MATGASLNPVYSGPKDGDVHAANDERGHPPDDLPVHEEGEARLGLARHEAVGPEETG